VYLATRRLLMSSHAAYIYAPTKAPNSQTHGHMCSTAEVEPRSMLSAFSASSGAPAAVGDVRPMPPSVWPTSSDVCCIIATNGLVYVECVVRTVGLACVRVPPPAIRR
jgi:hypothetical protein